MSNVLQRQSQLLGRIPEGAEARRDTPLGNEIETSEQSSPSLETSRGYSSLLGFFGMANQRKQDRMQRIGALPTEVSGNKKKKPGQVSIEGTIMTLLNSKVGP